MYTLYSTMFIAQFQRIGNVLLEELAKSNVYKLLTKGAAQRFLLKAGCSSSITDSPVKFLNRRLQLLALGTQLTTALVGKVAEN